MLNLFDIKGVTASPIRAWLLTFSVYIWWCISETLHVFENLRMWMVNCFSWWWLSSSAFLPPALSFIGSTTGATSFGASTVIVCILAVGIVIHRQRHWRYIIRSVYGHWRYWHWLSSMILLTYFAFRSPNENEPQGDFAFWFPLCKWAAWWL